MDMMSIATTKMAAFGTMAIIVPMLPTTRKRRRSTGTRINNFGGGGGEGLAAVGGHQCGAKGAAVEMPTFSRNNRIG